MPKGSAVPYKKYEEELPPVTGFAVPTYEYGDTVVTTNSESGAAGIQVAPDVSRGSGICTYNVNYNNPAVDENSVADIPEDFGASFSNKNIRAAFVRKVYSILLLQLSFTIVVISLCLFVPSIKMFVQTQPVLYFIAYGGFMSTYIALVCCPSVRRSWPGNLIMLCLFTVSLSYMTGMISSFHDTEIVLMSMGMTAAVCLAITLFAVQTKWDITGHGIYLYLAFWVVFLFGVISIAVYIHDQNSGRVLMSLYSAGIALIFSLYLVYDTQQIIGGRKVEISPEEHIYGALQLYLDVVRIFLAILGLGGRK